MLFVLVVCFAVGDICNVHHCSDTGNRTQTVVKLIYQMLYYYICGYCKEQQNKKC